MCKLCKMESFEISIEFLRSEKNLEIFENDDTVIPSIGYQLINLFPVCCR